MRVPVIAVMLSACSTHAAVEADPGRPFCASHREAAFCDDFDPGTNATWSDERLYGTSSIHVTSGAASSPPNALDVKATGTTTCAPAWRQLAFDPPPATLHLELDVQLPPADGDGLGRFTPVSLDLTGTFECSYALTGTVDILQAEMAELDSIHVGDAPPLPRERWVHVAIDYDGATGTAALSVDGQARGQLQETASCARVVHGLKLGELCEHGRGSGDVLFDNVLVTTK